MVSEDRFMLNNDTIDMDSTNSCIRDQSAAFSISVSSLNKGDRFSKLMRTLLNWIVRSFTSNSRTLCLVFLLLHHSSLKCLVIEIFSPILDTAVCLFALESFEVDKKRKAKQRCIRCWSLFFLFQWLFGYLPYRYLIKEWYTIVRFLINSLLNNLLLLRLAF